MIIGSEEVEIALGPGVAVRVLYGKLEGKYGRLKSMDSSTGRCEIELPDKSLHEILDKLLQTVNDKEYTENTKVISKGLCILDSLKCRCLDKSEVDNYTKNTGLSTKLESRLSINDPKDDDDIQIIESSSSRSSSVPWAVPDLLVRLIDKKYKDGRYYKEKMLVVDAPSSSHIELKDDRKRIHSKFNIPYHFELLSV